MLLALIPAHNEGKTIESAIQGLRSQTLPPDSIIVVADNCTDDTAAVARSVGAEVFETVNNKHKKAGGLNQALAKYLPNLADDDVVLVQDADSVLSSEFLRTGSRLLTKPKVGGVGGVFYGIDGSGVIGQFQRSEYIRYAREIRRRGSRAYVLTGTGTMFRAGTLREIAKARRDGVVPTKYSDSEREQVFWLKKEVCDSGCWNWTGRLNADGYGGFDIPGDTGRNRSVLAHRQAYAYVFGEAGTSQVLHRCDNPKCINPDHLFLGDHDVNMKDKVDKDRQHRPAGEANGRAKLSEDDVISIHTRFQQGESKADLARAFSVTPTTIGGIISGRLWGDIFSSVGAVGADKFYDTMVLTED